MSDKQPNVNDIVKAMSKLLSRWAVKGKLPASQQNKWGVDVLYNQASLGLLMFRFVTKDDLEVNLAFDLRELKKNGRLYIDQRIEIIQTQLEAARDEKQRREAIIVVPSFTKKSLHNAVNDAVNGVVH